MNIREMWCITCRKYHEPTPEHPACQCTDDPFPRGLHEVIPKDAHLDFRGWRFFAPFYCFYCGDPLCIFQFMFSRSCGGCDVSESKTARVRIHEHRIFAGKHERLDVHSNSDINPEFIDALTREDYPRLQPKLRPCKHTPQKDNRRRPGRSIGSNSRRGPQI